jgi:hypothetical protein
MKSWQQGAAPSASANANASAKPAEDHSKHKH